jgi:hypothetical protein
VYTLGSAKWRCVPALPRDAGKRTSRCPMDILTNEAYATCVCDAWIAVHSLTAFARLAVHYHATDFYCVLRRKSRVFCRARTGMHLFGRMRPSSTMSPAVPHTTGQRVTFRIDPVVEKSSVCERRAILECIPPTFFLFFFLRKGRLEGGRVRVSGPHLALIVVR